MAYVDELTWDELEQNLTRSVNEMVRALDHGFHAWDVWNAFRDARNDATIATALSKDEADVTDMRTAFQALKAIHDYAENQTPTQKDYNGDLRNFLRL
jgi:hypothetical protein